MYALLAGRPPFTAKNLPQMLQMQRFAKPEPVRRYAPDTPEQLERIIMQLLEKDPVARFPNTQVLARHLQAMLLALSRPAHDDFTNNEGQSAGLHTVERGQSLASERTLSEAESIRLDDSSLPAAENHAFDGHAASHDAATLATDEIVAGDGEAAVHGKAATVANEAAAAPRVVERPARFTTIEEEEARRQAENQRSWLAVAAQLAGLAAVLLVTGALVVQLSKPPTADSLYNSIASRAKGDAVATGSIESEVDEFLSRYASDPRSAEVRQYKERIELDKLERRLQREGRLDPALTPIERLYLQAIDRMDSSPDEAEAMLQSLIDLYGPSPTQHNKSASAIVRLSKRQLESLSANAAKQRERELETLHQRLEVAAQLSKTDPKSAAAMYRAIIHLHGDDEPLGDAVEIARSRLKELENAGP
jgi:hypothetical protein